MRDAVLADQVLQARRAVEARLAAITSGAAGPWVVLAPNGGTQELLERAQADAAENPGTLPGLSCGRVWFDGATAALADVDAAIAYLDGSAPDVPVIDRAKTWMHVHLAESMDWLTKARGYRKDLEAYEATARDVAAGALPAHVVEVLEAGRMQSEIAFLRERVEGYEKYARVALGELQDDRAKLAGWVASVDAKEAARERVKGLTWALSWPGGAATCPPRQPVEGLPVF